MDSEAKAQIMKALRSFPWYVAFVILFGPLILAPFTAGVSLACYYGYTQIFAANKYAANDAWTMLGIAAGIGALIWLLRQFFRAAFFVWRRNHRHLIPY